MTHGPATVLGPVLGPAAAAAAGLLGGRLVVAAAGRLLDRQPAARTVRTVCVLSAAAGAAVWWWAVERRGIDPAGVDASAGVLVARTAFHGLLLLVLAVATWVDLEHRVIPDAITVPGALVGLAGVAAWPALLLPVAREVPRSFAPPLREADVLGLCGPLHGGWPGWLAPAPAVTGLIAAAAVFTAWWMVCTQPDGECPSSRPRAARIASPRTLVAALGGAVVVCGWLAGGDHWRAVATSLGGTAVAGGVVWLTREGASRAIGREAMGLGDVTLMAMVGGWLGWQACVLTCLLAVFIGLAHGIAHVVARGEAELPFGPSLCVAAAVVLLAWRPLWARTADHFERPLDMAAVVAAVIGLTGATLWAWHRLRPDPPR